MWAGMTVVGGNGLRAGMTVGDWDDGCGLGWYPGLGSLLDWDSLCPLILFYTPRAQWI